MTSEKKPNILFLVPETFDALKQKGIIDMILERDENGFFEKVITAHPLAYENRTYHLTPQHFLYEFNLRKYLTSNKFGILLFLLPFKLVVLIKQLLLIVKKEEINLIRATDPYLMGFIALILSRLTKIPFCISIHAHYPVVFSLTPQKGFKKLLRIMSQWMPNFISPKAFYVMPISYYLIKAVSKKVAPNKIKVLPHGINFDFVPEQDLKEKFKLPENKKIISYVARLSKDNYVDDILNAMHQLSKSRDDFILVMIGDGEMYPFIEKYISEYPELKNYIKLLGFQSNVIGRSIRYISNISLCLMSGFSLIEAAAAATPLISYDIEWHSELVENNVTGFLIPENDTNTLISSINYLLDNPEEGIRMGKNAKEKAIRKHDIQITSDLKKLFYSQMIANQQIC